MAAPADPYHAFTRLVLTISEPALGDEVRTEHCFELRSNRSGAEVWRSSAVIGAGGERVDSELRLVGKLSTRQVIELLVEIERSGVYEALPAVGLVEGRAEPDNQPLVSLSLSSHTAEREVISSAPADESSVSSVLRAVRDAVAMAQERALSFAG